MSCPSGDQLILYSRDSWCLLTSIRLVHSRFTVCAVIDGKDVLISQCIKGRNKEKREALSLFLRPSQVPLRASNCLSIFLCEKYKWRLGTSLDLVK